MKNILTLVLFVFLVTSCNSENKFDITNIDVDLSNKIERVEPPNWWIDMKTKDIQLLIYGKNISNYVPVINSSNVKLISTERVKNENYLFVNISIEDNAKPENIEINFLENNIIVDKYEFSLLTEKRMLQKLKVLILRM
jgi:hypothetical protein